MKMFPPMVDTSFLFFVFVASSSFRFLFLGSCGGNTPVREVEESPLWEKLSKYVK